MFDTIYLHAGLPRTGSTHIQDALQALSQQRLLRRVAYPVVRPDIGSGNGAQLAHVLRSERIDDDVRAHMQACVDELLAAARGRGADLLLSSEHLFFATVPAFDALVTLLRPLARRVKLLLCVRPLSAWVWSLYMQEVKAHAQAEPFAAPWLQRCADTYLPWFANLDRFPVGSLVLPYCEHGLLQSFLTAIGEQASLAAPYADVRVNRSLTAGELELLRRINAAFADESLCRAISTRFIEERPDYRTASPPATDTQDFAAFAAALQVRMQGMASPLLTDLKASLFAPSPVADALSQTGEDSDLLSTALEEIRRQQEAYRDDGQQMAAIKRYARTLEPTRAFFDPIHYLLLHPDLALHEVDPKTHFRNHGRSEGRASGLGDKGSAP